MGLFLQNYSMLSSEGYDGLEAPVAGLSRERESEWTLRSPTTEGWNSYPLSSVGWVASALYHGREDG